MYDTIIIGARCAGASAAMLLGRMGHNVLLVDRTAVGQRYSPRPFCSPARPAAAGKMGRAGSNC